MDRLRLPFFVLAFAFCCGCATTHRTEGIALQRDEQVCRADTTADSRVEPDQTPNARPPLLNLDLRRDDELVETLWSRRAESRLCLASSNTQDSASNESDEGDVDENPFSQAYWKLVLGDIGETFTAPARWDTRGWLIFGGVAAGIGTVAVFDRDIQRGVQRNRNGTLDDVSKAVEPFGQEYVPGVLGAFYLGGELFHDERAKAVALDGASASIIASGLIEFPLKYVVGRSRPGDNRGAHHFQPFGGSDSFPSGHTTEAFALATVIAEHYDSLWIKFGAYGIASMVGYARMERNYHWASDVLAGAAIGTFVGDVVVHFNRKHWKVAFQPIIGPGMQGGQFAFRF
jgi:membrane-associated phospholipid phosphatase